MSEAICVNLYGDGSRDCRLRAEYVFCDYANECSAYREGTCFCVTSPFSRRCGVGTVHSRDGGTKRSKAFLNVRAQAKQHPKYAALKHPSGQYVAKIADKVFFNLPYVSLKVENDCIIPGDHFAVLCNDTLLASVHLLTPENIKRICSEQPRAIMGGVITDYQRKTVPMFLFQLQKLFPDEYSAFCAMYPDYEVKPPDWRGKYAKLITCNRAVEYKDTANNVFRFDGDYLVCDSYKSAFAPFKGSNTEVRIKATESMIVEIKDNAQVLPDTVFV